MSRSVTVRNLQRVRKVDSRMLRDAATVLLDELLRIEGYDISIVLLGQKKMADLNQQFLHHAGSTDVITFPYPDKPLSPHHCPLPSGEGESPSNVKQLRMPLTVEARPDRPPLPKGEGRGEGKARYNKELRGDIAICVHEAVVQARSFKTSWQAEVVRYVVHGVLHLLGYEDRTSTQRRRMKKREDDLISTLQALMKWRRR